MIEPMENEIWKPIKGYEELYEISNHGRVKSLAKSRKMPGNLGMREYPEAILKNWKAGRYPAITLQNNGKEKKETIHKLVARHFIDNPEGYTHVRHLDDNPMNPYYKNLAWGTQKMNMDDKVKAGRQRKGESVPQSILTEVQVKEIKKRYNKKAGYTYIKLAEIYGVNKITIGDILRGETWKHIN